MKLFCWINLVLIGVVGVVVAAQEQQQQQQEEEESTKGRRRKLDEEDPEPKVYVKKYVIVSEGDKFINFIAPQPLLNFDRPLNDRRKDLLNGRDQSSLIGARFLTKGFVFDAPNVALEQQSTAGKSALELFAGGLQPKNTRPGGVSSFFLNGVCTVTAQGEDGVVQSPSQIPGAPTIPPNLAKPEVLYLPTILAHQCVYDLCLGNRGFNCVNLYAGGGFVFNPFDKISFTGLDKSIVTDENLEPPLPPPFDLVIFGGTGAYRLVSGSATLVTATGRTRGRKDGKVGFNQEGSVVQFLTTHTNIPLKRGKKPVSNINNNDADTDPDDKKK